MRRPDGCPRVGDSVRLRSGELLRVSGVATWESLPYIATSDAQASMDARAIEARLGSDWRVRWWAVLCDGSGIWYSLEDVVEVVRR